MEHPSIEPSYFSNPRQSIFIGTSDRSDFLRGETGLSRFWVVELLHDADAEFEIKIMFGIATIITMNVRPKSSYAHKCSIALIATRSANREFFILPFVDEL